MTVLLINQSWWILYLFRISASKQRDLDRAQIIARSLSWKIQDGDNQAKGGEEISKNLPSLYSSLCAPILFGGKETS